MDNRVSEVIELCGEIVNDASLSMEEKYDLLSNIREEVLQLQDTIEFDRGEDPSPL